MVTTFTWVLNSDARNSLFNKLALILSMTPILLCMVIFSQPNSDPLYQDSCVILPHQPLQCHLSLSTVALLSLHLMSCSQLLSSLCLYFI